MQSYKILLLIIGVSVGIFGLEAAPQKTKKSSTEFRLDGAYYREENGKLAAPCSTNSVPPVTREGYIEKFTLRETVPGRIEVKHWDGVCSDMLFIPEELTREELLQAFTFSDEGLSLRSQKALRPEAIFRWRDKDP